MDQFADAYVSLTQWVNLLRLKKYFVDDTFKCIFLKEIFFISMQISLKFIPGSPIDNNSYQVIAWHCQLV